MERSQQLTAVQKIFAVVVLGDSLLAEIIVGDEPTETVSYCNRRKVGRLRSLDRRGSERHVLGPGPSCFTARVSFQIVTEDGSKMVVKLIVPQIVSSYISLEDEIQCCFKQDQKTFNAFQSCDSVYQTVDDKTEAADCAEGCPTSDQGTELKTSASRPSLTATSCEAPARERRTTLRGNLTIILSAIYAIFLVTVGVVIGVADLIVPETNVGEVFSIYLLIIGLAWYVFLHVDLLRHNNQIKKHEAQMKIVGAKHSASELGSASVQWRSKETSLPVNYMFDSGRHSGSFFLKIGTAGFCFGHLIHNCLLLARQILHFSSSDDKLYEECADSVSLVLYTLSPIYSFYQLYILFKYSNVIINRLKDLARFALMHSLATSLYFWFSMILRETVDSLHHKMLQDRHDRQRHRAVDPTETMTAMPFLMNLTGDGDEYVAFMGLWNGTVLNLDHCAGGSDFSGLILHVSPYLYPFSIEYSILVVGIWFIMWQNIGKIDGHSGLKECDDDSGGGSGDANVSRTGNLRNNLVIHADCHAANRGLFAGLLVLVATVVSIIIFFLAFTNDEYVATGIWINLVSESVLLILMIFAVVFACRQLSLLDVNPNPVSLLDDLLLFMCIPCFFLYGIFSIVPAMAYSNYMAIIVIILQVLQVILQTPFIIDGLRRCSNRVTLREMKPGRELVTFLIVCNIAMWIIETFEIKSHETNSDRIHFYGFPLWAFLSHVTLPLTLFYRFHSSACLVDIWKSAYERGE